MTSASDLLIVTEMLGEVIGGRMYWYHISADGDEGAGSSEPFSVQEVY
jgi:hypothetical protein